MLTYLIQSSSCLIILYGIYHFIFAEMTFFKYNRAYLLLSMMVSLMIPLLAPLLVLSEESVPVLHWSHLAGDITYILVDYEATAFDWKALFSSLLWAIYFVGATVVLLKMIYGLSRIYRYYTHGQKDEFNGYRIITTEAVHMPFSFFNGIYISKHVPLNEHIHTILQHEEIHIRQWHTLDVLLAEIVHAFLWFNPIMLFYKKALRQSHEFLADHYVCHNKSVSSYTELLLSNSQTGLELALTNQFFHSQIKKRIQMMKTRKTNRSAALKYALVLPVLIALVFIFSCKESEVSSEGTEPQTEEKTTAKLSAETYSDTEMENVFKVVEEMPRFPGCEDMSTVKEKENCSKNKMLEYIYTNLKYPLEAKEAGLEGQCVAQFIVAEDGSIENIKIVRDIGGGCGEAVRNVISNMNKMPEKWISGKQNGKFVKVMYTLPVKFKLEDDGKSIGMTEKNSEINGMEKSALTNDKLIKSEFELLKETKEKNSDIDKTSLEHGMVVDFLSGFNENNRVSFEKGDLIVSGNGLTLVEDVDYVVDYHKGSLRVINTLFLDGNQPLNVRFKN